MRYRRILCRHKVACVDRAQCDKIIVRPVIAHNAYGFNACEHRKVLRGFDFRFFDFFTINFVGFSQNVAFFLGDLTHYPDGKSGTGERLTIDKEVGKPQFLADDTDFVFEKPVKRLDNALEIEFFGKSADVVVRFYDRIVLSARLDNVGIYRALCKITRVFKLPRFFFKHVSEFRADDFTLAFRVGDAFQFFQKSCFRVDAYEMQIHL